MFARALFSSHPALFSQFASPPSFFTLSSRSALFLFNYFRTLSFSVAHVSPVPAMLSALLRKKPGGIPCGPTNRACPQLRVTVHHSRGTFPFPVTTHLSASPFPASLLPREPLRGVAMSSPLTPSPRLLRKNRGWGYPVIPIAPSPLADARPLCHRSPVTCLYPVLQWPASVPISSGEFLHA